MKTKNGTLKYILKKSVRGLIPDRLIDRKKQGFGVPVHDWLFDKLGDRTRRELDQFCDGTDFLDRNEVRKILDRRSGGSSWYLLNLAMWWKHFIAGERSAHAA